MSLQYLVAQHQPRSVGAVQQFLQPVDEVDSLLGDVEAERLTASDTSAPDNLSNVHSALAPPPPVRPASPLPPNVPTGPRNLNKYKDRDGNAPAVDGLDYGGGKDGRRTPTYDDDRGHSSRYVHFVPFLLSLTWLVANVGALLAWTTCEAPSVANSKIRAMVA